MKDSEELTVGSLLKQLAKVPKSAKIVRWSAIAGQYFQLRRIIKRGHKRVRLVEIE